MIVQFEKCELKIDQIHKEEFSKESFTEHEKKVIELIQGWLKKELKFEFKTSGSTGKAKSIVIERKIIEYSCESTMSRIDPDRKFRTALLCLSADMIGGAMVVFRALQFGLNLTVLKPTSNPFDSLPDNSEYDLTSMVPMQLKGIKPSQLETFQCILVGGAPFHGKIENSRTKVYATFGMTETVSHFALRPIEKNEYECIGDAKIEERDDGKLSVVGTLTDHQRLVSSDMITFISKDRFRWLGRADFVINSGGVKINPEVVEEQLKRYFDRKFCISSLPDERLGEMIVLIVEGSPFELSFDTDTLEKYEIPKEVYFLDHFVLTDSQKIDRLKTKGQLIKQLNHH